MGDRICLTFVSKKPYDERSPVLYAHWAGTQLIRDAQRFWELYIEEEKPDDSPYPGTIRTEPSNFMVNFLQWLLKGKVCDGDYYLYPDEEHCCSPDDNGFWELDTDTGEVTHTQRGEWE